MGSVVEKIPGVKNVSKVFDKIVPNELKPFAAPIAAYYLGPMALKGLGGAGLTGVKGFLARAAASGITSAGTQALMGEDVSKASTALSALSGGLGAGYGGQGAETAKGIRSLKTGAAIDKAAMAGVDADALGAALNQQASLTGGLKDFALEAAAKGTEALTPTTGKGIAKLVGGTGMAASAEKNLELMQKELDAYNASLAQQGVEDLGERRDLITRYMTNAGFDESQINDALTRYGYLANGGRVGYQMGGDVSYTDLGRSGVIYRDPQGNPISKEEFLSQTDEMEGIPSIRMKDKELTREDVLQAYADSDTAIKLLEKMVREGKISQADYDRMMRIERDMGELENLPYSKYADKEELEQAEKDMMQRDQRITDLDQELYRILENPKDIDTMIRNNKTITAEDLGIEKTPKKVFVLGKNGKLIVMPKDEAIKLGLDIAVDSFDTEQILRRENKMMGGEVPIRKNQGGIINLKGREMDLRGGGFVPIGKKEKADDVPARLSKNEFVFTADAVKGAGDGDINKGVKKMYNTMRMLEGKLA